MEDEECSTLFHIEAFPVKDNNQTSNSSHVHIETGSTEKLQINCSFDILRVPSMHIFKSITLFHADVISSEYLAVASITPEDGHVIVKEWRGKGFITSKGVSYLFIEWDYPDYEMAGHYKCEAHGITKLRKHKICSASAVISTNEISLESIHRHLKLVLNQIKKELEGKQNVKEVENGIKGSILPKPDVDKTILYKITNVNEEKTFVLQSYDFRGSRYLLSNSFDVVSRDRDQVTCMKLGGKLAKIESFSELHFVRSILKKYTTVGLNILISRNDQLLVSPNDWIPHDKNGTSLKGKNFSLWAPGQPDGKRGERCLYLSFVKDLNDWFFYDYKCALFSKDLKNSFLCEINDYLNPVKESFVQIIDAKKTEVTSTNASLEANPELKLKEEMYFTFQFQSKPYKGHQYYLSKLTDLVFDEKDQYTCSQYGGHLAEINDENELNFVRGILQNYTDLDILVLVAGTDKEGYFMYKNTTSQNGTLKDVPYLDFAPDKSRELAVGNCLYLAYHKALKNWFHYDFECSMYSRYFKNSFLCEIEEILGKNEKFTKFQ